LCFSSRGASSYSSPVISGVLLNLFRFCPVASQLECPTQGFRVNSLPPRIFFRGPILQVPQLFRPPLAPTRSSPLDSISATAAPLQIFFQACTRFHQLVMGVPLVFFFLFLRTGSSTSFTLTGLLQGLCWDSGRRSPPLGHRWERARPYAIFSRGTTLLLI